MNILNVLFIFPFVLSCCSALCFQATDTDGVVREFCVEDNPDMIAGSSYVNVDAFGAVTDGISENLDALGGNLDTMWILVCGILVFFMQAGFGMLEAGSVARKNIINILFKNIIDAALASISFWLFGYGIAYGEDDGSGFIGGSKFALSDYEGSESDFHNFFFQWAFSAAAATIVAGSVAERCKVEAYFIYSIIITGFIYPVVVHWVWDGNGWLSAFNSNVTFMGDSHEGAGGTNNMIDFAGSAVVHMTGGMSGLVAAIILGPRAGRFNEDAPKPLNASSVQTATFGVFILWVGWYGFNAGSTLAFTGGAAEIASKVAVNTTLAAGSGCLTLCLLSKFFFKTYDVVLILNGVLAGLVSITAPCPVVEPWAAIMIGFLGGIVYLSSSMLLVKLRIDDPLDAAPVHGFCGIFGALAVGIFGTDANVAVSYGFVNDCMSSGKQFGIQLVGVIAIIAWVVGTTVPLFLGLKYTVGFRVSDDMEEIGLDQYEHSSVSVKLYENKIASKMESRDDDSAICATPSVALPSPDYVPNKSNKEDFEMEIAV